MIGFTRPTRSKDFGFMETLPAILLMAALFFGGDWATEAAAGSRDSQHQHGEALQVAMSCANAMQDVDYEQLEPTAGYVPAPVVVAAIADANGDEGAYAVEVRITDLGMAGQLRRVEVRVGYDIESGERTWVETATVRQFWTATHADSQQPTSIGLAS